MSTVKSDSHALVAGMVAGALMKYAANPDRNILIDDVLMHDDPQGNHEPYFTVIMRSGARLLVSVTELPPLP